MSQYIFRLLRDLLELRKSLLSVSVLLIRNKLGFILVTPVLLSKQIYFPVFWQILVF